MFLLEGAKGIYYFDQYKTVESNYIIIMHSHKGMQLTLCCMVSGAVRVIVKPVFIVTVHVFKSLSQDCLLQLIFAECI